MTADGRLSRRDLCAAALAGAILPFAGRIGWAGAAEALDRAMARRMVAAVLGDPCRLGFIGGACLKALPETENSIGFLTRALGADRMQAVSIPALRALVGARIRRDFSEGAVITVEGWMLSTTEVRVLALAALGGSAGA